jgi:hypothetical protein
LSKSPTGPWEVTSKVPKEIYEIPVSSPVHNVTYVDSGIVRTGSGDVYARRDGNVYRNQGGGWQKYENGCWGNVETPQPQRSGQAATPQARDRSATAAQPTTQVRDRSTTGGGTSGGGWDSATRDQLNRDYSARSEGRQRTSDHSSYRSSPSRSSASSYRGGGGMRRGGGGRRR